MKNNRNTLGKRIVALMLSGMIAIGIQPATNVVVDAAETQSEEQENVTTFESGQTAEEILWVISEDLTEGNDIYYAKEETVQVEVAISNSKQNQFKTIRIYRDGKLIEEKKIGKSKKLFFLVPLDKGKKATNQICAVPVDADGNEINEKSQMLVDGKRILYDSKTPRIVFTTDDTVYQEKNYIYTKNNIDFNLEVATGISGIQKVKLQINGKEIKKDKYGKVFGLYNNTQYIGIPTKEKYALSMDDLPETDTYEIHVCVKNVAGKEYQKTYYLYRDTEAPKLESIVIPEIAENAGQMYPMKEDNYYLFTNKQVNTIITMTDGKHGTGVKKTECYLVDEHGKKISKKKADGNQVELEIPENF